MKPTNPLVTPLLTDMYQLTMAYAYWKAGKHNKRAAFDLFFRKCPFSGEFAVFAGLYEVMAFLKSYHFEKDDITYLKTIMPKCDPKFFKWLERIDCSNIIVSAMPEGTIAFPRIPLIRVEGPLAICQLLETTLLTLVNYPSLIATKAARFRLAVGPDKKLLDFGLRRAPGPDGGLSASRYSFIGGFDATSDVLAGKLFGLPVKGTMAHAFITSFKGISDIEKKELTKADGKTINFVDMVLENRRKHGYANRTNEGELAAFISYTQAFPDAFLALVDTYDTINSGVHNFLFVAEALFMCEYKPVGIRLDSGDLSYLSKEARTMFDGYSHLAMDFSKLLIVASNDIDEDVIHSLDEQGHEIDIFGIGTKLVTANGQTLGGVYKLVELEGEPRIKLSEDIGKTTIPGNKNAYRLIGADNKAILDLVTLADEPPPKRGEKILCCHPYDERKRINVTPTIVRRLYDTFKMSDWPDSAHNRSADYDLNAKKYVGHGLHELRVDHLRSVNPTPYKVSLSLKLYELLHRSLREQTVIGELR